MDTLKDSSPVFTDKETGQLLTPQTPHSPPPSYKELPDSGKSSPEPVATEEAVLKKELNLLSATSITTGVIIGSGIFISPVAIAANCGSVGLSLIVWLLSGLLCLGIAFCYGELSGMFPGAGGEYTYYKAIFGPYAAFLQAWVVFIIRTPVFYAILALTTTNYLFKPFLGGCDSPDIVMKLFSCWLLITVVAINCVSVKLVARIQVVLTVIKVLALVIISVVGIICLIQGRVENFKKPFAGTTWNFGALAVSMYTGVYNYDGWVFVFFLMEEIQSPLKNIPRANVISMILVITLYLMTNVAYHTVLTIDDMIQSKAVAVDFAARTMGPFVYAIPFLVSCSTLGALNGAILGGSRVYFAAARDGLFPSLFSLVQIKYNTPWPSVWLSCCVAIGYVLSGEVRSLLEYMGFILLLTYTTSVGCVLWLKWKKPNTPRPLTVSLFTSITCFIVMMGLVCLGIYQQPKQNGLGLLFTFSGLPIYWICVAKKNRPATLNNITRKVNVFVQKALLVEHAKKVD